MGRGAVQVTHRKNYVLALAYTEKRADMASAESTQHFNALNNLINGMLSSGTITVAKLQQVEAAARAQETALRKWVSLINTTEAIRGDKTKAEQPGHGFRFSAAFWHAAQCPQFVKNLGPQSSQQSFIGAAAGSRCISGGATSTSGNARALVKSRIYNRAMTAFGASQSPSQGGQVKKKKPKFKLKVPKPTKKKKKKSGRPKFRLKR